MDPKNSLESKKIIDKAQKILLVTNHQPSIDSVCSILGLYEIFNSLGKEVEAYCPGEVTTTRGLPNFEKIKKTLSPPDLIISFDYIKNNVDKINYKIEDSYFSLILTSKVGIINTEQIKYSYTGIFDIIISIGEPNIGFLSNKNYQEQLLYSSTPILSISNHPETQEFGTFTIVNKNASTNTELVVGFLKELGIKLNTRSAYCFLVGLKGGSEDFSRAKADTFEAASWCMRLIEIEKEKVLAGEVDIQPPLEKKREEPEIEAPNDFKGPIPKNEEMGEEELSEKKKTAPDKSWFLPKIFKSSGGKRSHS